MPFRYHLALDFDAEVVRRSEGRMKEANSEASECACLRLFLMFGCLAAMAMAMALERGEKRPRLKTSKLQLKQVSGLALPCFGSERYSTLSRSLEGALREGGYLGVLHG